MNNARTLGTTAVISALALTLVGCNQTPEDAKPVTIVEKERFANTEVCNAAPWIRAQAPAGVCEQTPVADDSMSLRRLHEERERAGR